LQSGLKAAQVPRSGQLVGKASEFIATQAAIGMRGHVSSDQPIAVLHYRVTLTTQLRFLAVALLVQLGIEIGGGLVRLDGPLLAIEARAVTS
jgi:hypothetical protein